MKFGPSSKPTSGKFPHSKQQLTSQAKSSEFDGSELFFWPNSLYDGGMGSLNLMKLVGELKVLEDRRKAGQTLTPEEEKKRKALKAHLKIALEEQKKKKARRAKLDKEMGHLIKKKQAEEKQNLKQKVEKAKSENSGPTPTAPERRGGPGDAFLIQGFDNLLSEAANSEAVSATFQAEKAKATESEIREMSAKAEEAANANKKRARVTTPEDVHQQLNEIQSSSSFVGTSLDFGIDNYYGGHTEDGYEFVNDNDHYDLDVISPQSQELHKAGFGDAAGGPEGGETHVTVPAGLAFLDDFLSLYQSGVLPNPSEDMDPDLEDPDLIIPGKRKVTLHLTSGEVKRGIVKLMRKDDLGFTLLPSGSGRSQDYSLGQIKALFIHKPARAGKVQPQGKAVTVTFKDRRQIKGVTEDYEPGAPTFSLVPPSSGRGQFERIIINAGAVASVR